MPVDAGKLDKRIIIQSLTESTGADGTVTVTWSNDVTLWAQFMKATSREFMAAQQVNSDITHTIKIRKRSGVTASHRLKFGTRIMNIAGPPEDVGEHGEEMLITAIEEV